MSVDQKIVVPKFLMFTPAVSILLYPEIELSVKLKELILLISVGILDEAPKRVCEKKSIRGFDTIIDPQIDVQPFFILAS